MEKGNPQLQQIMKSHPQAKKDLEVVKSLGIELWRENGRRKEDPAFTFDYKTRRVSELYIPLWGITTFPEKICELTGLRKLILDGVDLDSIPTAIIKLENLLIFEIQDPNYVDQPSSIPKVISEIPNLQVFTIGEFEVDLSAKGCRICRKPRPVKIEPFTVKYLTRDFDEAMLPKFKDFFRQEYFFHSKDESNGQYCLKCLTEVRKKGTPFEYIQGYRRFLLKVDRTGLVYNEILLGLANTVLIDEQSKTILDWMKVCWFLEEKVKSDTIPSPWKKIDFTFTDRMRENILYNHVLKQFIQVAVEFDLSFIRIGRKEDEKLLILTVEDDLPIYTHIAKKLQTNPEEKIDLKTLIPILCHDIPPLTEEEQENQDSILQYLTEQHEYKLKAEISNRSSIRIAENLNLNIGVVMDQLRLLIKKFLITYEAPSEYGLNFYVVRDLLIKKFRINKHNRLKNRILQPRRE